MANEIKVESTTTETPVEQEETKIETEVKTEETVEETEREEETPEARKARLQGSLKRMAKDLQDLGEDPAALLGVKAEKPTKSSKKSSELDYGEKAYLVANGIKGDEIGFVQDLIKKTGMTLDEVVSDDYAQAKLKSFREARTTSQAIPPGTKRSSNQVKDSVEYNLEKYESGAIELSSMPFAMRAKVLEAKLAKEKASKTFTFTPSV